MEEIYQPNANNDYGPFFASRDRICSSIRKNVPHVSPEDFRLLCPFQLDLALEAEEKVFHRDTTANGVVMFTEDFEKQWTAMVAVMIEETAKLERRGMKRPPDFVWEGVTVGVNRCDIFEPLFQPVKVDGILACELFELVAGTLSLAVVKERIAKRNGAQDIKQVQSTALPYPKIPWQKKEIRKVSTGVTLVLESEEDDEFSFSIGVQD